MNKLISLFLKGIGMGAANVIPGVSGGTIALITGIFERLINSIKSVDHISIKYLFTGKIKLLWERLDMNFLIAVFAGIAAGIISIARIFGYFLDHYPVYIMSFFFGLILASVFFVGKSVSKWNFSIILFFILGAAIAISLTLLKPAQENSALIYLILSGAVATCSMILPGLSGSFVLILMGNYQLVMIDAVNHLNIAILAPVILGGVLGLILFSKLLSWVFNKFRNHTISMLTGFILGSLGIIWPWKNIVPATDSAGNILLKDSQPIVEGYQWFLPQFSNQLIIAVALMFAGIAIIWLTETIAQNIKEKK